MPSRSLLLVAILILAVTVPFLVGGNDSASPVPESVPSGAGAKAKTKLTALWHRISGNSEAAGDAALKAEIASAEALLSENQQLLTGEPIKVIELGGLPGVSLADALRFDITPAWIHATWPRVTPQRMETGWYGLRIPLVTGTAEEDVTGALTYYFDTQNYVQRVTLYGYTGDAEPLISLVQQQYGLRSFAAVGRGLFLSFLGTVPIGILNVEDAAVQSADQGGTRYRVQLELNLPRPGAMLSEDVMVKLRKLRDARML